MRKSQLKRTDLMYKCSEVYRVLAGNGIHSCLETKVLDLFRFSSYLFISPYLTAKVFVLTLVLGMQTGLLAIMVVGALANMAGSDIIWALLGK